MKKKFLIHVFILSLTLMIESSVVAQQTAYNFAVTNLAGQQDSLNQFTGKKIAIVIVPSTQETQDSAFLDSLNALGSRYADSIIVIGIPSYETGYQDDSLSSLTSFYDSLVHAPCIITQGINTTKSSAYQDAFFAWLTNESQNGHFNEDVAGVGQSFFIDSSGKLFAVFTPEQPFNDALIQTIIYPSQQGSQ